MVTQQELSGHVSRKPFLPFRVTLASGETFDVTRRFRAVAMETRFVVATDQERLRWIGFDQIARVDPFPIPQSSN